MWSNKNYVLRCNKLTKILCIYKELTKQTIIIDRVRVYRIAFDCWNYKLFNCTYVFYVVHCKNVKYIRFIDNPNIEDNVKLWILKLTTRWLGYLYYTLCSLFSLYITLFIHPFSIIDMDFVIPNILCERVCVCVWDVRVCVCVWQSTNLSTMKANLSTFYK